VFLEGGGEGVDNGYRVAGAGRLVGVVLVLEPRVDRMWFCLGYGPPNYSSLRSYRCRGTSWPLTLTCRLGVSPGDV